MKARSCAAPAASRRASAPTLPVEHLLPRREHDPVRRQELDLDGGTDRLGQHEQGLGRGRAGRQRRVSTTASRCAPTRPASCSSRPPSGCSTGNTAGAGVARSGRQPDAAARPAVDRLTSAGGAPNVGAAVGAVLGGNIPPEAAIDSPDWYAPLTGSSAEITGLARARFATGGQFHWKLMWGAGEAPASWTTASEGESSGTVSDFGSIDLTPCAARWPATSCRRTRAGRRSPRASRTRSARSSPCSSRSTARESR